MLNRLWVMLLLISSIQAHATVVGTFDHQHSAWNALLQKHVVWIDNGVASEVDYAGFKRDRQTLKTYLDRLSGVSRATFDGWRKAEQLAFLINAYNAFTIELILTEYPELDSIKDLGSLFQSPWKKEFFTLLGQPRHLDFIEHEVIRVEYQEPLIHFGVNCASIGCPALRDEAFTADKLDSQLQDGLRRFLSDRSRNRYNGKTKTLEVSKIFDWFGEDFEQGHRGYARLSDVFAPHAALLADDPAVQQSIRRGQVAIKFIAYDWGLNDRDS